MPKQKLFDEDEDEEEVSFKTENEYAKRYDRWREKEELHKLEQKYGSKALSSDASVSSDSEDESDEPPEVTEETEAQFLKTLALLKTKDPRIYDPNFKFFDENEQKKEEKQPAEKTLTFEDSDDDDSDDGNVFRIEKKAEIEITDKNKNKKEDDSKVGKDGKLKDFLTGKVEHIDETVEKDLAPLKALWSDPALNEGEAFLRDYILNKRYLEEGEVGDAADKVRDDEALEEDERRVEEQGKFERAYNFRFEEPDDEFIKRYPRTMNYTRPKDDRRSKKRAETRTRKEDEKKRKMEEIARLKALKLKEIQEKIAKIKEVTGNDELAFREEDLEGDFDPAEHDRRMRALFDDSFYGGVDERKPAFPLLDDELEIENWETYEPERERQQGTQDADGPHCEDDDFNMDAEYDPQQARARLAARLQETAPKRRRSRKKKSQLARLLATEKPKFIPTAAEKSYSEWMEEYYALECEDVVGDLPTRFKYRRVVPNDYGLSVEEILLADDKELTQWVPLKKLVKHRPAGVEKSEVDTYRRKAADAALKRKILPSLFKDLPEEPEIVVPVEEGAKKKKKKKKNKENNLEEEQATMENEPNDIETNDQNVDTAEESSTEKQSKKSKKKKRKQKDNVDDSNENNLDVSEDLNKEKLKKKHVASENLETNDIQIEYRENNKGGKKKKRTHSESMAGDNAQGEEIKHKKKHKSTELIETINENVNNESIDTVNKSSQIMVAPNVNGQNNKIKKRKKKHKADGFIVENVQSSEPSHTGQLGIQNEAAKRKLGATNPIANKKHKLNDKKKFKNRFKDNKFKNKQGQATTQENPLAQLSDERLKAYGLNPKKYRSFLKYKKY